MSITVEEDTKRNRATKTPILMITIPMELMGPSRLVVKLQILQIAGSQGGRINLKLNQQLVVMKTGTLKATHGE